MLTVSVKCYEHVRENSDQNFWHEGGQNLKSTETEIWEFEQLSPEHEFRNTGTVGY